MDGIAITYENREEIWHHVDKIQGNVRARRIGYGDIRSVVDDVEFRLGVENKEDLKGVRVEMDPNAMYIFKNFKNKAESTHAVAEHDGKNWILLDVYRAPARINGHMCKVTLTERVKKAMIAAREEY